MTESNSAQPIPAARVVSSASEGRSQPVGRLLLCAISLVVACVATTQLLFPAHFETVDDINFTLLLSGVGLAHSPTYLTWFTNVLITYPLMCLFKTAPDVPWYSIYLFSSLIFGFSIIAAVLMLRFNRAVGTTLFLIYYVLVGAFIVNGLQYTSAAALLTQAAFLLTCCLPLTQGYSQKRYPQWGLIAGFVATVFAAMMRFEPFMLIFLYCVITAAAIAPWNLQIIKRHSKPIICFSLAVLLGVSLKFANNFYYDSQPTFAGIRELFQPFSEIADSDRLYQSGVELSENDYALVKQFFVADREIFTTINLRQAAQNAELPFTSKKLFWTFQSEMLPLALLCLLLLPLLDTRIMSKTRLCVWFAGLTTLILYLSFWMKLPPRLHLALMTCAMTTLFVFIDRQKLKLLIKKFKQSENPKRTLVSIALCSVAVWFTYSTISELHLDLKYYNEKQSRISQAIQRLNPQPGHLYIVLGTSAPYQYMRPFQNLRKYFSHFDIYRTSLWGILPSGYNMLENHGISSLFDACKSQNVYFVSDQRTNQLFADFCAEHYKHRPQFICVFADPSADFEVYRIKFKPI